MNKEQIDTINAKITDARQYASNFKPKRQWNQAPDSFWYGYWRGQADMLEEIKKQLEQQ